MDVAGAPLALRLLDLAGDALAAGIVDVVDDDLGALFGEALGDALAEPRPAAGHDRHLAAETHGSSRVEPSAISRQPFFS